MYIFMWFVLWGLEEVVIHIFNILLSISVGMVSAGAQRVWSDESLDSGK